MDGNGAPGHLEPGWIEWNGKEGLLESVNEVSGRNVAGIGTAFDEHLALPGLERLRHDLRLRQAEYRPGIRYWRDPDAHEVGSTPASAGKSRERWFGSIAKELSSP